MNENQSAIIEIMAMEATSYGMKITAHDKKIYNVTKTKQDGSLSVAWQQMVNMGLKAPDYTLETPMRVEVWYREVDNKHGGKSRYISTFREAGGRPITQTSIHVEKPRSGANFASGGLLGQTQPRNFDKEAYEKCCSIWIGQLLSSDKADSGANIIGQYLETGEFWRVFQAIRADGNKRFNSSPVKAAVEKTNPNFFSDGTPVADDIAEIASEMENEVENVPF